MNFSTTTSQIEVSDNAMEVSSVKNSNPDESNFPVLKIDTSGKILYANQASFEYLREWINSKNEFLPNYFISINPSILNPDADFSMSVNLKKTKLKFDVIGFKECGYIGLYAFN
jgi:hypothetical protein